MRAKGEVADREGDAHLPPINGVLDRKGELEKKKIVNFTAIHSARTGTLLDFFEKNIFHLTFHNL